MDRTERKLVGFGAGLDPDSIPAAVWLAASLRLLDTLGVALAAADAPTVSIVRRLSPRFGGTIGQVVASTWSHLDRTTIEHAALVNSAMVRYLDMSDAYLRASTAHPSDNLPALVALAEAHGLNGRSLLAAAVVTYEIHLRICDNVPFFAAGWDQSFASAPAAAIGCARLLGAGPEQMRHALAIAVNSSLATRQTRAGELSMWKGMAGPMAARQGVFAALASFEGMTGPEEAFDGPYGLWQQCLGQRFQVRLPRTPSPGRRHVFGVQQSNIKWYPVRDAIQVPVAAALALRERLSGAPVERLRIDSYRHAFDKQSRDAAFWCPASRESADHSLPACVAMALLDGELTPAAFATGRFRDSDVRQLCRRTELGFDAKFDEAAPSTRSVRLSATLPGGQVIEVEQRQTGTDIVKGLTAEAVEAKFHRLVAPLMSLRRRERLVRAVMELPSDGDVARLVSLTKPGT